MKSTPPAETLAQFPPAQKQWLEIILWKAQHGYNSRLGNIFATLQTYCPGKKLTHTTMIELLRHGVQAQLIRCYIGDDNDYTTLRRVATSADFQELLASHYWQKKPKPQQTDCFVETTTKGYIALNPTGDDEAYEKWLQTNGYDKIIQKNKPVPTATPARPKARKRSWLIPALSVVLAIIIMLMKLS